MQPANIELIRQVVSMVDSLIDTQNMQKAEEVWDSMLAKDSSAREHLYTFALATLKKNQASKAIILLSMAAKNCSPKDKYSIKLIETIMEAGKTAEENGSINEAIHHYRNALLANPLHDPAAFALAGIYLPGEQYLDILNKIHDLIKPAAYLEIGVSRGESISLAKPPTLAIGIDPTPQVTSKVQTETTIFTVESDHFFKHNDLCTTLKDKDLDLAFIDGLHIYEQVIRDFINVERYCHNNSIILLHDCLPTDPITSERDRVSGWWTGDVWKVIPSLLKYRPELDIMVVPTQPSGLAIVTGLNPESTILDDEYDKIVKEFIDLPFEEFEKIRDSNFNIVSNDWNSISQQILSTLKNQS
ncbi:MAG: class I SAM-dependent methyltransferase [Magnetococcales bacterium]|nr:class I SAM-dependent methyltransferase [Magnetococcales bacterium]